MAGMCLIEKSRSNLAFDIRRSRRRHLSKIYKAPLTSVLRPDQIIVKVHMYDAEKVRAEA